MENEAEVKKWANFYFRLRKQYEDGKPFTYELDLISNQPKPRAAKFMIMIQKFISIFKWGLRQTYNNEDERRQNYWTELTRHFLNDIQIGFLNEGYWQKPQNKIKKYFALLIHTKRIFKVLQEVVNNMGYLFQNQQQKRKNYQEEIKNLDFLKDGNYKVMGQLITSYEEYADKRRQLQKIKQIQRLQQERIRQEEEKKRIQREKQEQQQRKQRQRKEKQQQRKKKEVQQKMIAARKQEEKDKQQQQRKIITSEYFPQDYKTAFNLTAHKRINKDPSKTELVLPNNKQYERKMKNSERLFIERYKQQLQVFAYSLKPQGDEDKTTCFSCKCNLKQGVYTLGGNQNYCQYTGKWYCNNDISQQRMPIPWKAVQKFDLKGYTVSKVALAELKAYYEKPIIQIKRDNPITKSNKTLHDFLVIKRQIHLMYDSICNLDIIEPLLKKKQNYCLKINLFSMKNLYDIYNGQQSNKLQKDYEILSKHFYRCDICQKKKGYICPICKDPVKIFPFQIKETFGCIPCRKLYHRKCVPNAQCKCKQED